MADFGQKRTVIPINKPVPFAVGDVLFHSYNWIRLHQHKGFVPPAVAE